MRYCNRKWGPAACCFKANKKARLVERKVCFILDAGNWLCWGGGRAWMEGGLLSKGRLPLPYNQWARAFIEGGRGLHAEMAQSTLTVILQLVMWWPDQCHLDCFRYN